jgi:hypothetical protein
MPQALKTLCACYLLPRTYVLPAVSNLHKSIVSRACGENRFFHRVLLAPRFGAVDAIKPCVPEARGRIEISVNYQRLRGRRQPPLSGLFDGYFETTVTGPCLPAKQHSFFDVCASLVHFGYQRQRRRANRVVLHITIDLKLLHTKATDCR